MPDYAELAKEIVEGHITYGNGKKSYEPIYFDRGYSETDEDAMTLFLSGEASEDGFQYWRERAYDRLDEWASDSIAHDARELADTYIRDHEDDDLDEFELADEIRYRLGDEVTQDYAREWIMDMEPPVVRVNLTDEDHPDSWVENDEDWTPERLCEHAGIEPTDKNLKACSVILANAYYPGTLKMLYLVFRMNLSDVPEDAADVVRIVGEVELWACNPFMGDGMADTVEVDMTIERKDMATDRGAFGYSYDEVFGPVRSMIPMPKLVFADTETEKIARVMAL